MIFLNINCPFHLMSMASPVVAFLEHIYFCPPKGDLTNCHADKNIDHISFSKWSGVFLKYRVNISQSKNIISIDDIVEK